MTVLFTISTDVRNLNNILAVLKNKVKWQILIYSAVLQQDIRKVERDKIQQTLVHLCVFPEFPSKKKIQNCNRKAGFGKQ